MELRRTALFDKRLRSVKDRVARARIIVATQRMEDGNFGDAKAVGGGVMEARIHHGPGYRVYYTRVGAEVVILLLCGDKRTQAADVRKAIAIAAAL